MVDSRDFYGRSFMTPSVQNPVINPISPPSGHIQWNHPNHHPQPFNTDYQIPRYPPYSNIRKVSNGGPWIPGRHAAALPTRHGRAERTIQMSGYF